VKESNERKFLHDVASPIGAAMFLMDVLVEGMKARPDVNAEELAQAQRVFELLETVNRMLAHRREDLIQQGVPGSDGQ
jgi:hypothetical protein